MSNVIPRTLEMSITPQVDILSRYTQDNSLNLMYKDSELLPGPPRRGGYGNGPRETNVFKVKYNKNQKRAPFCPNDNKLHVLILSIFQLCMSELQPSFHPQLIRSIYCLLVEHSMGYVPN